MFLSPKNLLVASIVILAAAAKANSVVDGDSFGDESHGDASNVAPAADKLTFLQKHAAFFDRNHDGIIYPEETFEGFRAIGCGISLSTASAATIHAAFSQKTRPGQPSSPHLPIEVANIALAKHGSDSGAYDAQGNFVPSKFEEIFSKHARTHPNALTFGELNEMLSANRQPGNGGLASEFEWQVLYNIGKDKDGLLLKDTVRGVFDGSLFEWLEKERASKQ